MRKKRFILCLFLLLLGWIREEVGFEVPFADFVVSDTVVDAHETIDVRPGYYMLSPINKNRDQDGSDLIINPNFHFLAIRTVIKGILTGRNRPASRTSIAMDDFGKIEQSELQTFAL